MITFRLWSLKNPVWWFKQLLESGLLKLVARKREHLSWIPRGKWLIEEIARKYTTRTKGKHSWPLKLALHNRGNNILLEDSENSGSSQDQVHGKKGCKP